DLLLGVLRLGRRVQYPDCVGRMMRLSLTARPPGATSAATRTAFFSEAESTTPHSSTAPSCTITLISAGLVHGSALSWVSTFSRILASSSVLAACIGLSWHARACSRLAR